MKLHSPRWIALAALALGCTQVLGIEDARVDASFGAALSGATSSLAGSSAAGSAGSHGAHEASAGAPDDTGVGGKSSGPVQSAGAKTSGEGGDTTTPGVGGAPPAPTLCEQYCDKVTSNCKGKYEQYRSFDQCVEVCKRLPPGEHGDEEVNSVSCRLRQADFAESEPFVYCKSAGPLGAGKCSSNCISYCSLMQATCTAASTAGNVELSYFASTEECVGACNALPSDEQGPQQYSSSASAEPSSFVGNNVFCRTYHVTAALEQDSPDEHCPHAMGGDPCIAQ